MSAFPPKADTGTQPRKSGHATPLRDGTGQCPTTSGERNKSIDGWKSAWKSSVLARSKRVVVRTERDHAHRGRHCCKDLRSTAVHSRSRSGTEWRSEYVAKCCSKKTAGMNP